jgi:hypothetical protein
MAQTGGDGWSSTHLDDVSTLDDHDLPAWKPLRHVLGLGAFGVNAWVGRAAGDDVIEDHDEMDEDGGQEELYFVSAGRARFEIAGEEIDAPAGTLVAVRDPSLRRRAVAMEAGTLVLAVGAVPGAAFTPSKWETSRVAEQLGGE